MYFPSDEERRYVQRRLLPEARQQGIAEELRGWSWARPPLQPVYAVPLGVYEVAGKYCPTGRDVYLRRVERVVAPPNRGMVEGRVLHQLVADLLVAAKRVIYQYGAACLDALEELRERAQPPLEGVPLAPEARPELQTKLDAVRAFETRRIVERVQDVLARQPQAGPDTLVALALPVHLEVRLNGTYLGLSPHLSADGVLFTEMMVADLKFGPREEFHRLTTTGYALVLESLYEVPVDVGCIVYVSFRQGRVLVERDFHVIGDELRHWFLEEREEKMRLVSEELDPGLPAVCPRSCPYLRVCRPDEERRGAPEAGVVAANPAPDGALALAGAQ
ncbi:MAG TPA: type I-A CRISPR-associated protein Cas4/Csa1 [Chloroflexota bacterium]|nr:type I-A CRISPR-associated protein Cas4/Csa1 [Chloroflexota bacterium]HZU07208.1 type I-A CRISPR-associated protein Cas4/Csa1 [Chloroflexota bacterium]